VLNAFRRRTGDVSSLAPAETTDGALLSVQDVAFSYSGIQALAGITLSVGSAEAVCIVGPNGAGKTTLAKVIAGALRPASGEVHFAGRRISGLRPSEVPPHGVAIVLEGRHVFNEQSVQTNLELGAYWRRLRRSDLDDEIERVYTLFPDLRRFSGKAAESLSGGQQQMLCVGRALMGAPRLMILDEPSMGLSPKLAGEVYDAMKGLLDEGLTLLLVEQNAELAFRFCARGYLLQYGRVVLDGTVEDLRRTDLVHKIYLGVDRIGSEQPGNLTNTGMPAREEEHG
jgi:branched-chain amino acid transport system ATP-binding protein